MTPEEIMDYQSAAEIVDGYQVARIKTIEAIHQYAKEMCDKQRGNCVDALGSPPVEIYEKLTRAPYPKELQ
jgi:hypothetical protein